MYTHLQRLAIWVYSIATPFHKVIERRILRTTDTQLQKHVRFFSSNTRQLFPEGQVYVFPGTAAPNNYLLIDKKYTATIRQCRELTEETGHSLRVLQISPLNRKSYTGIYAQRLIIDRVVRNNERSFLAQVVAEHRADGARRI